MTDAAAGQTLVLCSRGVRFDVTRKSPAFREVALALAGSWAAMTYTCRDALFCIALVALSGAGWWRWVGRRTVEFRTPDPVLAGGKQERFNCGLMPMQCASFARRVQFRTTE